MEPSDVVNLPYARNPAGYEWCIVVAIHGQKLTMQTVYAWSLKSALEKAEGLPLAAWFPEDPDDLTAA
jgi:hypothetical protein